MSKQESPRTLALYSASNRLNIPSVNFITSVLRPFAAVPGGLARSGRVLGGHRTVRENLTTGLRDLGVGFLMNARHPASNAPKIVLAGQKIASYLLEKNQTVQALGPNTCVTPREYPWVVQSQKVERIIVPSKESAIFFGLEAPEIIHKLRVWPSGIDEMFWRRSPESGDREIVTVYVKTEDLRLVEKTIETLAKRKTQIEIITYGQYSRAQFREALSKSKAAVWIGHYESQGIAQFEAWSMGVPTFVFKSSGDIPFSLPYSKITGLMPEGSWSPAPYLEASSGAFWRNQEELANLLESLDAESASYDPRSKITQAFTLRNSAAHLLEIIEH